PSARNQWRFRSAAKSVFEAHLSKVRQRIVTRRFRRRARLIGGSNRSRMTSERHFGKSTKPFATSAELKSPTVGRIRALPRTKGPLRRSGRRRRLDRVVCRRKTFK